jgi:predicted DNA-binding transcriptional regulator YafY
MGALIFIGIVLLAVLIWMSRKTTKCEVCNKAFSRLDAMSGKLTLKLDKIMCSNCARSLPLTVDILNQAIKAREKIAFDYATEYGTSRRTVDPYLIENGRLHAWCNQQDDVRTFSMKKMKAWDVLSEKFKLRKDILDDIKEEIEERSENAS